MPLHENEYTYLSDCTGTMYLLLMLSSVCNSLKLSNANSVYVGVQTRLQFFLLLLMFIQS